MIIIACGGRDYDDPETVNKILSTLKIDLLVNGAAKGADSLAAKWAEENKIPCMYYPALWSKEGKKAGVLRNIRMLDETSPDLVVAFPGGKGTAHMIEIAKAASVPVWDVSKNTEFGINET